jgi:hypothetical protein
VHRLAFAGHINGLDPQEAKRRRQRLYRARRRDGLAIAPAPYTDVIVQALVNWNLLPPCEAHSREEIGRAMFEALEEVAEYCALEEAAKARL